MKRKEKQKRKSRKRVYGLIAVAIIFLCVLAYSFLHSPSQTNINQEFSYKAAIVDHLSLFEPNPTFNQTCTTILEEAGFTVDYYSWEEVTVNFYRNLPSHGYGLIVLRVHSATSESDAWVCLFTSEPYSKTEYIDERLIGRVGIAYFHNPPVYRSINPIHRSYFGVNPDFIRLSTNGRFQNTIIIMMGCDGLRYPSMAEAFIKKGAKAYISWDKGVLASHTDQATMRLLQHLITEKQTIEKAVTETNQEVGPDPESGSILRYYPDSVSNYLIPNSASNLILKDAIISGFDSVLSSCHVHCPRCGKKICFH